MSEKDKKEIYDILFEVKKLQENFKKVPKSDKHFETAEAIFFIGLKELLLELSTFKEKEGFHEYSKMIYDNFTKKG